MGGLAPTSRTQTLPRTARVRKRREFLAVQRCGRRFPTRHFLVLQGRESGAAARLGITVTRKLGGAVERNGVKRAVRETFRRQRAALPAGLVLVVIARDGAALLGAARVAEELQPVFSRLASQQQEAPPVGGTIS